MHEIALYKKSGNYLLNVMIQHYSYPLLSPPANNSCDNKKDS